ncbi:unnamed protein product [Penicillium pancosmium]
MATAILRRTSKGPKPSELRWKCIADFVNLCYHPEDSRQNFVVRWRNALQRAQQELGVLNNCHIYEHFIIAIRSADITSQWRNYLELDPNSIDQNVLEEAYAQFLASETCSLLPSQYQTPLFLSASSTLSAFSTLRMQTSWMPPIPGDFDVFVRQKTRESDHPI